MRPIRVAATQFQHHPGLVEENLKIVAQMTAMAAEQGVQLIAFPECCLSGYWHLRKLSADQLADLAEPLPHGRCGQQLLALAAQYQMTIGAGLVEMAADGRMYNSYFVAMPDGNYACHRKLHMFISEHLHSGDQFTVFDTPHGCRVGVLICYDNNLGENVRINALMGAEVLLSPHQTGGCLTKSPCTMGVIDRKIWDERESNPAAISAELTGEKGRGWLMRWLPTRAHDNGLFLVFSNGVGPDDDEVRTGNAMVIDPYGRIINETTKAGDEIVIADLDPNLRTSCTGARWISARRPGLYAPLTEPTGKEVTMRAARFE